MTQDHQLGRVFSEEERSKAVAKEHEQFQLALGRLTLSWSDAESALYCVLRFYSGVSADIARSIFSGVRARVMIAFIGNIAHNTNMEHQRKQDLEAIFGHMASINSMRDKLVHHVDGSMIEFDDDNPSERVLSNESRTNRKGKGFKVMVGSRVIHNMCDDLHVICWRLLAHRDAKPFKPYEQADGKLHAWLYRPPQLDGQDRRNGATPQR